MWIMLGGAVLSTLVLLTGPLRTSATCPRVRPTLGRKRARRAPGHQHPKDPGTRHTEDGMRMPRPGELPASLVKLARRQALELSHNGCKSETSRLLRVLDTEVPRST
jgi:hypothetical protein